jgi:hypothetical protein
MGTNFIMGELKLMSLQQSPNDNPRLCLSESRADASARSTPKRNIREGRRFSSPGEALGTEILRMLPNMGITVRKINGVKETFARSDVSFVELDVFHYAPITDVNGGIQA